MPRRWKRKSQKYLPEIEILLRDAIPTWFEIEGEFDSKKREMRGRESEIAKDELVRIYRDARKRGVLNKLDFRLRLFCERLMAQDDDRLPPPLNTGRPSDEHRRLLIALHVKEAIEARGSRRGSVEAAVREVAARDGLSYDQVRDIYYDRDPEWRHVVAVEFARRKAEETGPVEKGGDVG